ncbi:SDR family oxidoreductase [uncultured Sunxiuqinia sp.]|uniref:SDR family oxidoreductase n=1 Tax=Sunxiuqinia rutila TaxID=1397841 RepID=UPI002627545B|nr:SDR family oxidoreductase [uncultured Sunxiuqinia sp.]
MKDKIVVITGASSGIGKALAYEFAARGASLSLAARRLDRLEEIKNDLPQTNILTTQADVSLEQDCKNLIEQTIAHFGRIDVLINNAGISMRALFSDLDLDVIRKLMDVNFWGTVYCTKYAIPHLLAVKGTVVGVISIAGYVGLPARTGYSASKYAIRGFLDALRIENRKTGLHVLVAAPGFTASEVRESALTQNGTSQGQTPRNEGKMMTAEACARHIANAVKKRKREIILTFIEGKFTVFLGKFWPTMLDRLTYIHMGKEANSPFK